MLCAVCVRRILGTPNEEVWPGVTSLQDWNEDFPFWPALHIAKFTPGLSEAGIDLLEVPCPPLLCWLTYIHTYIQTERAGDRSAQENLREGGPGAPVPGRPGSDGDVDWPTLPP